MTCDCNGVELAGAPPEDGEPDGFPEGLSSEAQAETASPAAIRTAVGLNRAAGVTTFQHIVRGNLTLGLLSLPAGGTERRRTHDDTRKAGFPQPSGYL
ncbi:hypothetical protein GCM10023085_27930 [Actinomadura viridis]